MGNGPEPIGPTVPALLRTIAATVEASERSGHELRPENISPVEVRLLEAFQRIGLQPQQQFPIGRYFADFYFPEERLVVEVDGRSYHSARDGYDRQRDRLMRDAGYAVCRIPASLVRGEADRCAGFVRELLDRRRLQEMKR